jgi:hypothetical protein
MVFKKNNFCSVATFLAGWLVIVIFSSVPIKIHWN